MILTLEDPFIALVAGKWLELLVLFAAFQLIEVVHDTQGSIMEGVAIGRD